MNIIQIILCIVLLITSIFASFSTNPIQSVLFLILCFCISAGILFLYNIDFLALLYIMVYVGAVAVLFLFVIMMLNIKVQVRKKIFPYNIFDLFKNIILVNNFDFYNIFVIIIDAILALILFHLIIFYLKYINIFLDNIFFNNMEIYYIDNITKLASISTLDLFGQMLFNYFGYNFIISGIILLIALIGSIFLTLHKTYTIKT